MTAQQFFKGQAFRLEDSQYPGIRTLTFDLEGEKVNKFSKEVMQEFSKLLEVLESDSFASQTEALVLFSGKKDQFIAGADIKLIQSAKTADQAMALAREGQMLLNRWEDLRFPTVVGVEGPCLGGGCELALASRAIVASQASSTRIGLPETMLGILPGMGGCVRMPRKIGLAQALDIILAGKAVNSDKAFKMGLVDMTIPAQAFQKETLDWVKQNVSRLKEKNLRLGREPLFAGMGGIAGKAIEYQPLGRAYILSQAKKGVLSATKGKYPAPLEVLAIMSDIGAKYGPKLMSSERDAALEREARGFGKMAATHVSKNLIHIFFMTENVKKSNGLAEGVTVKSKGSVTSAAVLGAGVMGGGIAQLCADKNVPVRMKDITQESLKIGMASAAKIFQRALKKKKLKPREYQQKMNKIAPVLDFAGFQSVDAVVEAVVENMDVKKKVLADLENYVRSDAIIASNTSSLSITEMQTALKRPEQFGGMHFFNPVHRMPLVEVIRGEKSSDETVSRIYQFCKQLGKTPIVVKDKPGFLVNRLLMPFLNEAAWLVAQGTPIDEVDAALYDFGMPMGALELLDEIGIDTAEKVAKVFHSAFGEKMQPSSVNSKLNEAKRFGKKNGKGFYTYDPANPKKKALDHEIYGILGVSPQRGKMSPQQIIECTIYQMVSEAAACLDQGIVRSAEEVDLGMIMGTGFPPFRGGLLKYADEVGVEKIYETLKGLSQSYSSRLTPTPELEARAKKKLSFYSA